MSSNGTFIKLYRKMTDWEWYSDTNCVRVFLHFLLKANWEDSEYRGTPIPRGSMVIGRLSLSKELGLSERCLRTTINRLRKCHAIDQRSTNQFSVVSVCNFDTYNPQKDEGDQPDVRKRPVSDQQVSTQVTTSKEYNKKRREEDNDSFELAWANYGRKGNKATALRYWNKLNSSEHAEIHARIPEYHADNPEVTFRKDFQGWINPSSKMWRDSLKLELTTTRTTPKQSTEELEPIFEF